MILAIDPGPTKSAWLIFDPAKQKLIDFSITPNEELLADLRAWKDRGLTHLVIEMIASFGMPVGAEVFDTCVWIGRFIQASGLPHSYVYRKEVKLHLCGTHQAKDPNIRQALLDRFGPQGTKKDPGVTYGVANDVWSALAVAVTYSDMAVMK